MIKSLKRNDIRSTPFVANKSWNSQNQTFDNTISWQSGSQSGSLFLSFVDYKDGTQLSSHSSSIAYQQQDPDFLRFRIGQEITGTTFYPTSSKYYDSSVNPTNIDGTYQGLVYNTLKNLFYKETANPTQIFGLESLNPVDVNRTLTKQINVFNVPQNKFGEKIVPNSIEIKQQLDDGHFVVIDDGNTNLKLSGSHFVDVQNAMYNCVSAIVNITNTSATYDGSPKSASVTTNPLDLITITTYNGSETPPTDVGTYTILSTIWDGYYCGSTGSTFIINKADEPVDPGPVVSLPTITVTNVEVSYDGTAHYATATTNPLGLNYTIGYTLNTVNVSDPIKVGVYIATATVDDGNYNGTATGTVKITPKQLTVTFSTIADQEYGTSKLITLTASSNPETFTIKYSITSGENLAKILTENGSSKISLASTLDATSLGPVTVKAETTDLPNGFTSAYATQSFNVTPKPITLNPTVYYPGSGLNVTISTPSISSQLVTVTDDVTITGPSAGTIPSSSAGTYTVTTVSSYALGGTHAAKYSLTQPKLSVDVTNTITLTDSLFKYDGNPYTINDIINQKSATLGSNIDYTIQFFDNTGKEIFSQKYNSSKSKDFFGPTNVGNYTVTITNKAVQTDTKTAKLTINQAQATVTFSITTKDAVFEYLQFNNCNDQIEKLKDNGITSVKIKGVSFKNRGDKTVTINDFSSFELKVTYDRSENTPTASGDYQIGITGSNANFLFILTGTPKVTFNDVIYIVYRNGHSFVQDSSKRDGLQIISSQYYTSSNHNLLKFYYPSGSVNDWSSICKNNSKLKNYKFTDYTGFSPVDLGVSFISIGAGGGGGGGGGGTLVTWGFNGYAQITGMPTGPTGVTAIAAGVGHTVALKSDGTVVAWGYNGNGQTTVPDGLTGVTAIAAGGYHTVALKSDGTVVAWGYNGYGETTVPARLTEVTAIAAGGYHTVALKSDGTVVAWGYNGNGQTTVPDGLTGVTAIAAGGYHTVALKSDGTVVAWGADWDGETTVPDDLKKPTNNPVTAIAAGAAHTVALKRDGTVVAWGHNQLADHVHKHFFRDGTVVAWGWNDYGQRTVPEGLTGVTAISAGYGHTVALKSDGTVVAWGYNKYGQTTVPDNAKIGVTAIAAGSYHTVVLMEDSSGGGAYVGFSMPAKYLVDHNINTMKMVTYGVGQTSPSVTAGGPAFFVTESSYTTNSSWLGIYADGGGGTTPSVIGVGGKSYINKKIYSGSLYQEPYSKTYFIDGNNYYESTLGNDYRYNTEVINIGMIDEFNTAQYGLNGDLGGLNGIQRISTFKTPHLRWGQGGSTNNSSMCEIRIRHSIYQIYLNGKNIYDVNNI